MPLKFDGDVRQGCLSQQEDIESSLCVARTESSYSNK